MGEICQDCGGSTKVPCISCHLHICEYCIGMDDSDYKTPVCPKCSDRKYDCPVCNNAGEVECEGCGGTGEISI